MTAPQPAPVGSPCDFYCGYVSSGRDLWEHVVPRETISRETGDEQDKECSKCRCLMDPERKARYCKDCHADYMRDWRRRTKVTAKDRKLLQQLKGNR